MFTTTYPETSTFSFWPNSNSVRSCTVTIDPPEDAPLFGFGARGGNSTHTLVPLEANAIAFGEGSRAYYLISIDALYGGEVRRRFAQFVDVPESQVLIAGSHTHFAPGVDHGLPRLGPTSSGYVTMIAKKLVEALAIARVEESVTASVGTEKVDGLFVNRRHPVFGIGLRIPSLGRVVRTPNPAGPVDETVRLVAVSSGDAVGAVIWSAACHPVCSPEPLAVSACFPGKVREAIREYFDEPKMPVLFLQGFSGDVRPASMSRRPPRRAAGLAQYILGGARAFVPQSPASYESWCNSLADSVLRAAEASRVSRSEAINVEVHSSITSFQGWARPIEVTMFRLAQGLSALAANAEMMSERVVDVATLDRQVLPVGCVNEVFGYWPTGQMYREGGYEGCSSRAWFPKVNWGATPGPDETWGLLLEGMRHARRVAR